MSGGIRRYSDSNVPLYPALNDETQRSNRWQPPRARCHFEMPLFPFVAEYIMNRDCCSVFALKISVKSTLREARFKSMSPVRPLVASFAAKSPLDSDR